ncbi:MULTISPECIES: O-acetyl-ADP-ribose deacetylase [unclassified Gilliamella]|uniref:O-acetyl-ADP-ribose deacetylase n=1 Tax=unclassified Gilliamella TaxID=2685620 RepID=UPI002269BC5B|nr:MULTISPECIES: O-acetyl-ADP-ribose deacetylase [unclassified Gilliamella]MCX8582416.1 O-acetyl-ADP-ribose deacetylase [Gilliamella sp. B3372]MCX8595705.1 O-acetyl-ADP-ribose deacetylase [Gilliamella sp. B3367]
MKNKIDIIQGDITKIAVDAIVNAANSSLLGGSGVDGAIHRAGGKQILDECQKIRAKQGSCKVGEAVVTTAGNLPAKYVIHTVGPRWNNGNNNEVELLRLCYLNCFTLAHDNDVKTISFPNISTGIYKFPKNEAAKIALQTIKQSITNYPCIKKVNIVCFESDNFKIYCSMMKNL